MLNWRVDPVTAWMPNMQKYADSMIEVVDDVLSARADEITAWMQTNHPWQNRTGLAESNVRTAMVRDGLRAMLILYHPWETVERRPSGDKFYPIYLERVGSQWGVLQDALDHWSPILLDDLRRALK